jgi:hypothetical protein
MPYVMATSVSRVEEVDECSVPTAPSLQLLPGCYRLFGHLLPAADRLQAVARDPSDMTQW